MNKVSIQVGKSNAGSVERTVYNVYVNDVYYAQYDDYDKALMVAQRFELDLKDHTWEL